MLMARCQLPGYQLTVRADGLTTEAFEG